MSKKKKEKELHKSIKKQKKSNLPLILSISALLISLGQLIFTIPIVLRYFERVEIQAFELGIAKPIEKNYLQSSFLISNNGRNTAKNVEMHLRILKDDNVLFIPEVFKLSKNDNKAGIAKNQIYKCDELVPGENVRVYVYSDFSSYLKINSIDTLFYDKTIKKPNFKYGPHLKILKHSLGKINIKRTDSLTLKEIKY